MALQFIMAGAQLALGAGKAFAGHQQQQAQYRQAKSAAQRQNMLQRSQLSSSYVERINSLMDQQQAIADAFGARVGKAKQDIKFLDQFAADKYTLRQEQLNRAFEQQAFADQASAVKLAQSQGVAAASGQTGVTASRRDFTAPLALAGINRAITARQVTGMIDDFDMQSEIDNKRFAHEKYSIGQRAAVLPRFGRIPSAPTMPQMQQVQNPGSMGLYMGLAQAGISAAGAFQQFSPQGPKLGFDPSTSTTGIDMGNAQLQSIVDAPYTIGG